MLQPQPLPPGHNRQRPIQHPRTVLPPRKRIPLRRIWRHSTYIPRHNPNLPLPGKLPPHLPSHNPRISPTPPANPTNQQPLTSEERNLRKMSEFEKKGITRSYSTGPYNKMNDTEQWIRLSQGCPNNCDFCYEPSKRIQFPFPLIERNKVKIMDMNLLSQKEVIYTIKHLGGIKVDNKVVYYELVCGIDHRFLYPEIAEALKISRFIKIRLAWDFAFTDQYKLRKAYKQLLKAGYRPRDLTIFMICNWKISYEECLKKLYLCAIWSVKVADCYFDGQLSPNIEPIGWTADQIKDFRKRVRKHNQLINFGIDPELREEYNCQ